VSGSGNGNRGGAERAPVFGDDIGDLSDFAPRPPAPPERVRSVAERAGFRSRDPRPAAPPQAAAAVPATPPRREPRRYRTGRNVQLNIKARAEDIEAFYALADRTGLVLGEVFARAVAALGRELSEGKRQATE